jgi:hypothetical protein
MVILDLFLIVFTYQFFAVIDSLVSSKLGVIAAEHLVFDHLKRKGIHMLLGMFPEESI